jgi:hypothetical protein
MRVTKAVLACAAFSSAFFAISAAAQTLADQTATLLPDDNILLTGGYSTTSGLSNQIVLINANNGSATTLSATMSVARASHTATLLPNGDVLLVGGVYCSGNSCSPTGVSNTAEVYNPVYHCMYGTTIPLTKARYDHTATLLSNGSVLVCGGQDNTPTFHQSCEMFTPSASLPLPANDPNCSFSGAPGAFNTSLITMTTQRTGHTATLLSDGRVFIAGGYNSTDGFLLSTELYDPSANAFSASTPLSVHRAYHTATLMGDNQVLIAGGIANPGDSTTGPGPGGYLAGTEIYDPTSGSVTLGQPMEEYKALHTATLQADGGVYLFGGLGTITTTYVAASGSLQTGSTVTFNSPCAMPSACSNFSLAPNASAPIQSYNLNFSQLSVSLGVQATGMIKDGYILFSSANVSFASGTVVFGFQGTNPPGSDGGQGTSCSNLQGAAVCLAGVRVTCGSSGNCGQITLNNISLSAMSDTMACGASGCGTVYVSTTPVGTDPNNVGGAVSAYIDLTGKNYSVAIATIVINSMIFGDEEQYSPAANTWTFANHPNYGSIESYGHAAVLRPNDSILATGGLTCSAAVPTIAPCSPANQNLRTLLYYRSFATGSASLQTARANHTSTLLSSGTILTAGGENVSGFLNSAEILNPNGNSVTATGSMSYPRALHTATLLVNGNVLVAGGQTDVGGSTQTTATAEIYFSALGAWAMTGSMQNARQNHGMLLLPDGTVLVAGGNQLGGSYLSSAEVYASTTGLWSATASLPYSASNLAMTLLRDGAVLACGGINAGGPVKNAAIYTPGSGWVSVDPMPAALYNHQATLLPDGRVLVTGGDNGGGETSSSYIFNPNMPSGSQWSATGPLQTPRFGHNAVALPDGEVWVIGGAQGSGIIANPDADEFFDPYTQSWSTYTFEIKQGRIGHTTVLAPNGYLYVIGGSGGGSNYLNSIESGYFTSFPDALTAGAPPSIRQPAVTGSNASSFYPGNSFTLTGSNFQGMTEGSSGGGAGSNSFFYGPRLSLQALAGSGGGPQGGGGFTVDLSTELYYGPAAITPWNLINSSLTAVMGAAYPPPLSDTLPLGWYQLRVGANAQFSNGYIVQAGPLKPAAAPTNIMGSTLTATAIQWTWNPVSQLPGYPVDGYDVYDSSTGLWIATVAVSGAPSYVQTNAVPGSPNAIIVAAYNLSGDGPSAASPAVITATASASCSAPPGEICGIVYPTTINNVTGSLGDGELVQLTIPAGSFATSYSSIEVLAAAPSPLPCGSLGTGIAVALSTVYPGANIQPTGSLQLVMSYTSAELPQPTSEYSVMRYDPVGKQCHPVPTTFDSATNLVTATIDQLATYEVTQIQPASTLGPVEIYPNPFYPSRSLDMTFANLPSGSRLRIFTTRGLRVLDVSVGATGTYLWNGSNASGQPVASGLYLAVIQSNGGSQIHKIVILR